MADIQGKKLRDYLRSKEVNLTELAPKLGISRPTLYSLFKEETLTSAMLDKLNAETGFQLSGFTNVKEEKREPVHPGNIIFVPAFAYGGFLTGYRNPIFIESLDRFRLPGITGEHYAFEISGMSMYKPGDEKSASSGDIAISRPVDDFKHMAKGKGYILQTVDGIIYKEFDEIKNDVAHFRSINKEFDGRKLPLREIKKVYFVNFILKKTY